MTDTAAIQPTYPHFGDACDTLPAPVPAAPRPGRDRSPSAARMPSYDRIEDVIEDLRPSEPVFGIKPAELRAAAARFKVFPGRPLYAVKCNPHPLVLETLFDAGISDFDVASLGEIQLIEGLFGKAAGQFYNNPAKPRPAIAMASEAYGVRFYTADCIEEVEKILEEARLSDDLIVAVRMTTQPRGARYVLSTKFGASQEEAVRILQMIAGRGVRAGITFHVGSQCLAPHAFGAAMTQAGKVARRAGVPISVINVGGGFPAPYPGDNPPSLNSYFSHVVHGRQSLKLAPGYMLLCEPGRSLVATAGTVLLQVVVRRGRCLYLNDGVFGTLQELGHPKERRPVRLLRNGARAVKRDASFKIYGPTCDSNDVLGAPFLLPDDVREGDWIEVGMMGAYSLSMRTAFNGFYTDNIVTLAA
jgi:ornithine decarboxylase